jgi:hypothetical protein
MAPQPETLTGTGYSYPSVSDLSILTGGFKIGGIDGHGQRHGASCVVPPATTSLTVGPWSLLRSEPQYILGL